MRQPTPTEPVKTLRDLRADSNLSLTTILERLKAVAPAVAPTGRSGIIHWENRGTRDKDVIDALATVYGVSFDVANRAAAESRRLSPEIVKFSRRRVPEPVIIA